tara:strand:+ start:235 stop:1989 length:1755 start_codon:yes stop_codon:yes gene_type:complete
MSGQPNINSSDKGKFREQYLASLELRAKLDNVNHQANKVYKRTGQIPSEPSDFRSLEEKLVDTERMRREARAFLTEIADGREANKISMEMTDDQMIFYTQQKDTINPIIKQQFRLGVYADTFLPFLNKYMNDTAGNYGISTGLQQSSGKNVMLNSQNLLDQITDPTQLSELLGIMMTEKMATLRTSPEFIAFQEAVEDVSKELMRFNGNPYTQIKSIRDEDTRGQAYRMLNDFLQEIPTNVEVERRMDKLERYMASGDIQAVKGELNRTRALMEMTPDVIQIGDYLRGLITATAGAKGGEPAPTTGGAEPFMPEVPAIAHHIMTANRKVKEKWLKDLQKVALEKGMKGGIYGTQTSKSIYANISSMNAFISANFGMLQALEAGETPLAEATTTGTAGGGEQGRGFSGRGLFRPSRKYHHPKATDWDKGVNPTKRFVPLGRYIINKHRLDDDVVALKRPAGSCIKEFPSQRVSGGLGKIIRHIVGGGIPDFDDLEALDDGEKAYLHRLSKETHILDRLSIPAPKKNESDKEIDKFNIMRGEIMSGNDNKELIKKFKLATMKLMNLNKLPKSQAREILFDLTSMGF